jgi:hypothetical protein
MGCPNESLVSRFYTLEVASEAVQIQNDTSTRNTLDNMPSASTLSSDDKAKVKKAVPTSSSTNKIVTAAVARVYQAEEGSRA